jgi:hypothetical protein
MSIAESRRALPDCFLRATDIVSLMVWSIKEQQMAQPTSVISTVLCSSWLEESTSNPCGYQTESSLDHASYILKLWNHPTHFGFSSSISLRLLELISNVSDKGHVDTGNVVAQLHIGDVA